MPDEEHPYEPGIGVVGFITQLSEKPGRKKKNPIGFRAPDKTKAP